MYPQKRMTDDMKIGAIPGTTAFHCSDSCWVNGDCSINNSSFLSSQSYLLDLSSLSLMAMLLTCPLKQLKWLEAIKYIFCVFQLMLPTYYILHTAFRCGCIQVLKEQLLQSMQKILYCARRVH